MTSTRRRPRLGWVVDVQKDFMDPGGRLYVHNLYDPGDPGASMARASIVRTVEWMRGHCDCVVFTGDWHAMGDREIDPMHPDATRGTYPPHCMGASSDAEERDGAALIPEIDPGEMAVVLDRDATPNDANRVARTVARSRRPAFIRKREFSVFEGNPATDAFLTALRGELGNGDLDVLVCGVATDVCVRHAVDGFLDRGYHVTIVRDATWGLGVAPDDLTWGRWAARGARVVTSDQLPA